MTIRIPIAIFILLLLTASAFAGESTADNVELPETNTSNVAEGYEMKPVPYHLEKIAVDSRLQQSLETDFPGNFRQVIELPGAVSLRLHFSEYELGRKSYITIISLQDGGDQQLDSRSLPQWENATAVFNGDAVEIELHVDPDDIGVFFVVDSVVVSDPQVVLKHDKPVSRDDPRTESLCSVDNRTASSDGRVGRLYFGGCTAWLISNGRLLTAGHCVDFDPDRNGILLPDGVLDLSGVVEFNVPASLANGTTVAAHPDDQYPINTSSVVWRFDGEGQGLGKDWSVFTVNKNSNTNLTPFKAQGGFFRTTNENPTAGNAIRVTGMGLDNTPTGSTGNRNAQNFTNQTSTGNYVNELISGSDIWHRYAVDTTGGSSGSPVIWGNFTIGIHTNAGCAINGTGANSGTSFEVNALETAIDNHPGSNTIYADKVRSGALENGTIYHPHDTFDEAVTTVPVGGKVSIVKGTYSDTGTYTKQMFIVAPVGDVLIGQ